MYSSCEIMDLFATLKKIATIRLFSNFQDWNLTKGWFHTRKSGAYSKESQAAPDKLNTYYILLGRVFDLQ